MENFCPVCIRACNQWGYDEDEKRECGCNSRNYYDIQNALMAVASRPLGTDKVTLRLYLDYQNVNWWTPSDWRVLGFMKIWIIPDNTGCVKLSIRSTKIYRDMETKNFLTTYSCEADDCSHMRTGKYCRGREPHYAPTFSRGIFAFRREQGLKAQTTSTRATDTLPSRHLLSMYIILTPRCKNKDLKLITFGNAKTHHLSKLDI